MDPRVVKHAKILVNYSTKVEKGDKVIIQISDYGIDLASEIYKEVAMTGGSPLIIAIPSEAVRGYFELTPKEYLKIFPSHYYELVKSSDVLISIRSEENTRYLPNVDPGRLSTRARTTEKIDSVRMAKRWCLTQYPTNAYAQEAEMSLREYEDFVYSAILLDWKKEREKMYKFKEIMDKTDLVRIICKDTDLAFSIKHRKTVISDGTHNLPGGEVFSAPIENSTNGEIYFDLPAIKYGREAQGIYLKFKEGVITGYSAEKNYPLLKAMINTDRGSRRLGEIGIGTNFKIKRFSRNILFDEKIGGTIHLAIGLAYKECKGVNESAIHWDMIKTMRSGEVLFDGETILKNGKLKI